MTTSLAGYATQLNPTTQVVCAYASAEASVEAIVDPGVAYYGVQIGSFTVPEAAPCRLSVIGFRSNTGVACTVRLIDPDDVAGSAVTVSAIAADGVHLSQPLLLAAGKTYNIAMKVTASAVAATNFAVIRLVHLADV